MGHEWILNNSEEQLGEDRGLQLRNGVSQYITSQKKKLDEMSSCTYNIVHVFRAL